MTYKTMLLKPRVTEKNYRLYQTQNVYAFSVPTSANKHTVASAVSEQFGVVVEKVAVFNTRGKVKRTVRKGGRPIMGSEQDTKKAYVTLKKGDHLPIFDAVEEAEKAEEKAEKKDKSAKKGKT